MAIDATRPVCHWRFPSIVTGPNRVAPGRVRSGCQIQMGPADRRDRIEHAHGRWPLRLLPALAHCVVIASNSAVPPDTVCAGPNSASGRAIKGALRLGHAAEKAGPRLALLARTNDVSPSFRFRDFSWR